MITLTAWLENQDLRRVCQNELFLRATARAHRLQPGEAVLFSNTALNRFRLVANINGLPVLIIPPVAVRRDLLVSMFLKVSIFIRGMSNERGRVNRRLTDMIETRSARMKVKAA